MILTTPNIDVGFDDRFDAPCLTFKFKGKFTQTASEESTLAWKEAFAEDPHTKFIVVWDCMEMTGFEMSARREWLKYMHQLHDQIDRVMVISDSVIIRGSARLMLKLFQFKSELFDNYRQVWERYPSYV